MARCGGFVGGRASLVTLTRKSLGLYRRRMTSRIDTTIATTIPCSGRWLRDGLARCHTVRFQPLPVEPCVRFSRTRITDVLHRRRSAVARHGLLGRVQRRLHGG